MTRRGVLTGRLRRWYRASFRAGVTAGLQIPGSPGRAVRRSADSLSRALDGSSLRVSGRSHDRPARAPDLFAVVSGTTGSGGVAPRHPHHPGAHAYPSSAREIGRSGLRPGEESPENAPGLSAGGDPFFRRQLAGVARLP